MKKKKKSAKIGSKKRNAAGLTPNQATFLEAFEQIGEIEPAFKAVGLDRTQHYKTWRYETAYAEAFKKAQELFEEYDKENVAAEIRKRSYGWTEEVVEEEAEAVVVEGNVQMVPKKVKRKKVRKFSTPCLLWRGNQYFGNPARLEVVGKDGGPLKISVEAAREIHEAVTNGKNGDE